MYMYIYIIHRYVYAYISPDIISLCSPVWSEVSDPSAAGSCMLRLQAICHQVRLSSVHKKSFVC